MGRSTVVLSLLVLSVLATAKEYVLEDLLAVESGPSNRRVIHNIGDDAGRKMVRQSRIEDTIRTVQEPITGPGLKQEPVQSPPKDKGGGASSEDEDKKTLLQQVLDGKYGLIQTEIFSKNPERPGIISYEVNPEVPKDNVNNLGGLKPEEIWLAENHVLVLGGGGFQGEDIDPPNWPPIDNYIAPHRQVKIPPNPKVPPPFPVQLKPGGPVEFIKNENGTGGPPPFLPFLPPLFPSGNGSVPFPPAGFSPGNFTLGNGPYPPPFPFYPPPNGSFLPPPGFLPPIPPGAAFLPPQGNLTEPLDEDDPSIYYPPPYDFYYPKDNTSLVPAGPLVPGIVLPPPPDFFAPYKNTTTSKARRPQPRPLSKTKTPTRKPTKHKNVQVITSTKGYNDGVTIRPNIGKVSIVNTTPRTLYKTHAPPVTTKTYSSQPKIKTISDGSLNEITPETIMHELPPNAEVKGWVPIPAPRPYYITGQRKPLRKGTVSTTLPPDYNSVTPPEDNGYIYNTPDYELSVNSWLYPNKTKNFDQEQQYFKVVTESPKQYYYNDYFPEKGNYYSSTESPLGYEDHDKLKTLFYPTRSPHRSTIQPDYPINQADRAKSLKTYYFYEEPQITQGKLTDTDSLSFPAPLQSYREGDSHTITQEVYVNSAIKHVQNEFKPSPLDYFYPQQGQYINIQQQSQKSNTESPLQYYFAPENPKSGYNNYGPYPEAGQTTPKPATTTKPPVYEYSFSIPGYGSANPPKVGVSNTDQYPTKYEHQSTPQPYEDQVYTTPTPSTTPTPVYKSEHQESQYYTTQRPSSHSHYYSTQTQRGQSQGQYYTTPRPQVKDSVQTENPYHAFFTHHDAGLIDDITKKYFTTFGQKLNKDSIRGDTLTTPLPPVDKAPVKSYYPQTSPRPQYYEPDRPRTRYPQNSPPVSSGYISTVAPPVKNYQSSAQYSNPTYNNHYYDQRPHSSIVSTQKPISLESDILVNYKEPLPPLNPDAEFIDPSSVGLVKPDQAVISYRLPGNGGHFYFLTPQVAQQRQQYSDYIYNAESSGNYYNKRNARRPTTQRRRPNSARTS